jgi:thymidylate synthase (FAD)
MSFTFPRNGVNRTRKTNNPAYKLIQKLWIRSLDGNDYEASEIFKKHCEDSYHLYQTMLTAGIAREMARMVLPINIYTEIYACWDLKNLLHFITLREDSHAQAEIQAFGTAIKTIAKEFFPWTLETYEKYKWELAEVS